MKYEKLKLRLPKLKGRAVYRSGRKHRATLVIKKGEGRYLS